MIKKISEVRGKSMFVSGRSCVWIIVLILLANPLVMFQNDMGNASVILDDEPMKADEPLLLKLKQATFDPLHESPRIPPALANNQLTPYCIVQFNGPIMKEWRDSLEDMGVKIFDYLPDYAYIIAPEDVSPQTIKQLEHVRSVSPWHPAFKISPSLSDATGPIEVTISVFESGEAGERWQQLKTLVKERQSSMSNIQEPGCNLGRDSERGRQMTGANSIPDMARLPTTRLDTNVLDVIQQVASMGGEITSTGRQTVRARITSWQIHDIARIPHVNWIQEWVSPQPHMNVVREYTGANYVEGAYGYNGSGVILAIADTGIDDAHPDLQDAVYAKMYEDMADDGHGTCCAGIMASRGIGDSDAEGMAPGSVLLFQDAFSPFAPSFINMVSDAYDWGAKVHSNSYGTNEDNTYGDAAQELDQAVYNYDVLICTSAGSTGINDLGDMACNKNGITVGGINDFNSLNRDTHFYDVGTIGPTADGRIKPDLAASAVDVYTTDMMGTDGYSPGNYYQFGGTSAACPIVAGACGPIIEAYMDNHFQNNPGGAEPSAAMLKGLLIANAHQLQLTSANRSEQGWGEPDIAKTLDVGYNHLLAEDFLLTGMNNTYKVQATGVFDLKIALVWTDIPASPGANVTLVNNLDLTVTNDTETYRGNYGLDSSLFSPMGGTNDSVNNVECVFIDAATAFGKEYTINVSAMNAPTGQDYALVVSGVISGTGLPYWPEANDDHYLNTMTPTVGVMDVDWSYADGPGNNDGIIEVIPSARVRAFSDTDPNGINVELVETAADSNRFEAVIDLTTTGYSDQMFSLLRVSQGDILTLDYVDVEPTNQTVQAACILDTIAPEIFDVLVSHIGKQQVLIEWSTSEPANSVLHIGTGPGNMTTLFSSRLETYRNYWVCNHGQYGIRCDDLTGDLIRPGTDYVFQINGTDIAGNTGVDDNGGNMYKFRTPEAQASPSILYVNDDLFEDVADDLNTLDLAYDYHAHIYDWDQNLTSANSSIWGPNTQYDMVIWDAGMAYTEIWNSTAWYGTPPKSDRDMISEYVNNGGNFMFVARDGAYDPYNDDTFDSGDGLVNPQDEGGPGSAYYTWFKDTFQVEFQYGNAAGQTSIPNGGPDAQVNTMWFYLYANGTGVSGGGSSAHNITGGPLLQGYQIDQNLPPDGIADQTQIGQGDWAFNTSIDLDTSLWIGNHADAVTFNTSHANIAEPLTKGAADDTGEPIANAQDKDGLLYEVRGGETLEFDTWDIGGLPAPPWDAVTLRVWYETNLAYNTADTIQWAIEGNAYQDTGIIINPGPILYPEKGDGWNFPPDVDTLAEIQDLNIRFTNTDTAVAWVRFDYVWIEVVTPYNEGPDEIYAWEYQDGRFGCAAVSTQGTGGVGRTVQIYQTWYDGPKLVDWGFGMSAGTAFLLNITNWLTMSNLQFNWDTFKLEPDTSISGHVYDEYGTPLYGIIVNAYDSADIGHTTALGATWTNSTGFYRISGLNSSLTYDIVGSFYRDYGYGTNESASNPVTVIAGTDTPDIDVILPSAEITGTVTDKTTGLPIEGAELMTYYQGTMYPAYNSYFSIYSDVSGVYHITGLPSGIYDIVCSMNGYYTETKYHVEFNKTADIMNLDFQLRPIAGTPTILVVDDDALGASTHNWNEILVMPQLDSLGYSYDVFTVPDVNSNGPDAATMDPYNLVLWSTGWQYDTGLTLTATDQVELANYLDNTGGTNPVQNLLLIGSDVVYGLDPGNPAMFGSGEFMYDYMYAQTVNQDLGCPTPMEGVPGTWADGVNYTTVTDASDYSDEVAAIRPGGEGAVYGRSGTSTHCAIDHDAGAHKTLFFCADLAYFTTFEEIEDCLRRMIEWFSLTPAAPPSDLLAEKNIYDVVLTWTPSAGFVTQYNVYRSTNPDFEPAPADLIGAVPGGSSSFTDTGAASDANTYFYIVRAENAIGEDNNLYRVVKTAAPLSVGWNLYSTPLIQNNTDTVYVLSPVNYSYARTFDGQWMSYNPAAPPAISDLLTIDNRIGVWIEMTSNDNLATAGYMPSSTVIILEAGWNLVSYPSLTPKTISEALLGTGYDAVNGFNASAPYQLVPLLDTYMMQPGEGYWIHVPADTAWVVSW